MQNQNFNIKKQAKSWVFISLLCLSPMAVAQPLDTTNKASLLLSTPKWGLTQPGTSCIEYYEFRPNQEVLISSHQERITGTYRFVDAANKFELPAIVISFETDNQKPDCAGNADNQAGISTTNFLKTVSEQKIFFCNDALGKQCSVYLVPEK